MPGFLHPLLAQLTTAADSAVAATAASRWGRTGLDSVIDGNGVAITLVGIAVVFFALAMLALLITGTGRLLRRIDARRASARPDTRPPEEHSGEAIAAIALALELYFTEIHDDECAVITLKSVSKPYSPWSSKIHTMTRRPHRTITFPGGLS